MQLIDYNQNEALIKARLKSKKVYEEYVKNNVCPLQPLIDSIKKDKSKC